MQTQFELFPSLPVVLNPGTYWRRYENYLRSTLWRHIRRATLLAAEYRCQVKKAGCFGYANEVHHLSYLRWNRDGDRPGIDTIAICSMCHRYIHSHPVMVPDNDNLPANSALSA